MKMQCLVTMSSTSWLYVELTVWRDDLYNVMTWPCDEFVVWRVDCDELTFWRVGHVTSWLAANKPPRKVAHKRKEAHKSLIISTDFLDNSQVTF